MEWGSYSHGIDSGLLSTNEGWEPGQMETEAWFLAGALPANAHVMSLLMEEPTAALSSLSSLDVQLLGIARRRGSRARALCKIRDTKKIKSRPGLLPPLH